MFACPALLLLYNKTMNRRDFLAALAAIGFIPPEAPALTPYPVRFRKPSPYESVFQHIQPGSDEFAAEKEALAIESILNRLIETKSLPIVSDFRAPSPFPSRYLSIAIGVSRAEFDPGASDFANGLHRWIESLGVVRRSRFFVLPENRVRYEIASSTGYRTGVWRQTWKDGKLQSFEPVEEVLATAPAPLFRDITAHSLGSVDSFRGQLLRGNTFWRARLDAATGIDIYGNNGVAVADIDNDGRDEIYVCQPAGLPNCLYKVRDDGMMDDITRAAGLDILDDTTCALFIDFRNSGRQDLVVLRASGPLLFLNDGAGKFELIDDAFRFAAAPQGTFTGMAAADYDRDGHVDLYLCCYVYFQSEDQYRYPVPYHDAQNGPPNFLFRNRLTANGGYFEDVTEPSGMSHNNNRYSFAPAWCDFDNDGWPDLYVANDFGRNNLYRNRKGTFRDEAAAAGVEDIGPGMSASWFDYDNDGQVDLYVANMWTSAGKRLIQDAAFKNAKALPDEYRRHTKGNSLYRNLGDGKFDEVEDREGVGMGRWSWCADAFDFDNDGSPEIFVTSGMLTNPSGEDLESFFWRQVVAKSPLDKREAPAYENGWNAINQLIREDYSWNGREPNVFYVRRGKRYYDFSGVSGLDYAEDSRTFAVTDLDSDGNLDLILRSRLGPQVRIFQNNCGTGKPVVAVKLRGIQSNRDSIGAKVEVNGRVQFVTAGSGYLSQHTKTLHFALDKEQSAEAKITWPSGRQQTIANLAAGYVYEITEGSPDPKPTPFHPRANWPSGTITPQNIPEPVDVWLLEPVPLPDYHRGPGFLLLYSGTVPAAAPGLPIEAVNMDKAPPDFAAQYSLFRRYLFEYRRDLELPLLLLIDDQSRAHKIYATIPDVAALRRDLKFLGDPDRAARALPFPGRYYQQPHRNYFKLGAAFYWAGYPDQALPYLDEVVRRAPDNWKAFYAIAEIHFESARYSQALENYRKTLAARPDYGPALLGAGESLMRVKDFSGAEKMLEAALDATPKNADAANQFGLLRVQQNRTAEAKQWFERAIEFQKDHSGAINNLGVLYMNLGQPNDAIAAFEFGIEQSPDDDQLYLNLGRVYIALRQPERARATMQRLLARKPGDPVATRALADLNNR